MAKPTEEKPVDELTYEEAFQELEKIVETLEGETLLALAVKVGNTRLIDNCLLRGDENK